LRPVRHVLDVVPSPPSICEASMTVRRTSLRCSSAAQLVSCLLLGGCASSGPGTTARDERLEQVEGQVVTEEQIAKSGARTVWEVLQLTVHNISFNETSRGQPTRITRRGRSSVVLDDGPRVLMDGVALTDYSVLARMPASDVQTIEVLGANEATTLYGTNHSGGVIRIHTKTGG
jgi:TonB-dependent starch-binding outer membrane protein SusC